jgi:hypothetical protein
VAALLRDLPEFTLRLASANSPPSVEDWPAIFWRQRRCDDALSTQVTIDIGAATADTITPTL